MESLSIWLTSLSSSDVFVLNVAVLLGLLLGKITIKRVSLGISGVLFSSLVMGMWFRGATSGFFEWNLILFVVSVGLLSSEDFFVVMKKYGIRFVILGIVVTFVGAFTTSVLAFVFSKNIDPFLVAGTYTGALTSSPGLAAALEMTAGNPLVTIGYTLSYPLGMIFVVLLVQIVPMILGIDLKKEQGLLDETLRVPGNGKKSPGNPTFSVVLFVFCVIGGVALGKIKLHLPWVGSVSLGSTGGCLLFSLFCGALGQTGSFHINIEKKVLGGIRSISLAYFLAVMGLSAGPQFIEVLRDHGLILICIGLVTAVMSGCVGFLVGRYVFRINWILLAGSICGAMTSTPGLGAAIDATGGDDCSAGYGATYPVAIVCMVIFTKLMILILGSIA